MKFKFGARVRWKYKNQDRVGEVTGFSFEMNRVLVSSPRYGEHWLVPDSLTLIDENK